MEETKNALTFTDANFEGEVLRSDQPVLVQFWATWCGPCRRLAPIIEELAEDFEGRVKVGKLDVDQNRRAAAKYGIRSIPTLIFFKSGEVEEELFGALPKGALAETLEALAG